MSTTRIQLDPTLSRTSLLDGGWWPRSTDAAVELPAIVAEVGSRRGTVTHLLLNPADWDEPHPRLMTVDGRRVHLAWFTSQPAGLLTMICDFNRDRIDLLIVPPASNPASANSAMATAADTTNTRRVTALLTDVHAA